MGAVLLKYCCPTLQFGSEAGKILWPQAGRPLQQLRHLGLQSFR
jgi:hypothetical protein